MKKILLGVTGGVAAYKAVILLRLLQEQGFTVRVVMTESAKAFVSSLTFQAVSGHRVYTQLIDDDIENSMAHIELARWADLIVIAPATANFIAKCANGFADDLLSTLCMASKAPLFMAPAMNCQMWSHQSTQANVATIKTRGAIIVGPDSGVLACGDYGPGRMIEPEVIVKSILAYHDTDLFWRNKKVLITAGPTHEAIDPIRYIGNKSSGKMGYALAQAAHELGASVTLISGPSSLSRPCGVDFISVNNALQMHEAVMSRVESADFFIGAAAVANYRVQTIANQKIKSQSEVLSLSLIKNPDIISEVALLNKKPFVIGFAAETENVLDTAIKKMHHKKLDMIVANQVGDGLGMGTDTNTVTLFGNAGYQKDFAECDKLLLAKKLLDEIKLCAHKEIKVS